VPLARQALRKLLDGRIQFLPHRRGGERVYHVRWALRPRHLAEEGYLPDAERYKVLASPRDSTLTPALS
jgi:hypothetical protein